MKKTITIICSEDVPVKHLLNNEKFDIYETAGNEEVFAMDRKNTDNVSPIGENGADADK